MHLVHGLVDDLAAALHQLVYHVADGLLVARNRAGGDDDEVAGADLHLAVVGERHPGQGAHWLALAARRDQHDLLLRVAADLVDVDQRALRDVQIAHLGPDGHHVDHAAAGKRHLAPILDRAVDNLLDAAHVRSERRDDDAVLFRELEQAVEGIVHLALGLRVAGALRVGGVAEHGEHALLAQLGKAGEVDHLAHRGGAVDFEVPGMHDGPRRGMDGQRHRVRDGVVDMNEFHVHAAEADMVARPHHHGPHLVLQPVLLELAVDQGEREPRAVNREVEPLE